MRGAVAQIGSAKSQMTHVASKFGRNTTTKASSGQFGSSVQTSDNKLRNSTKIQSKKFNYGQTNMV
jgi:hypothetical protein